MSPLRTTDEPGYTLTLLDLLYAVPLGDLAIRLSAAKGKIPMLGWGDAGLVFAVLILSWYGHHRNRSKARIIIGQFGFFQVRFLQFLIEIGLIVVYFFMGRRIYVPDSHGVLPPSGSGIWQLEFLVAIFAGYLLWDLLDAWLSRDDDWTCYALRGGAITLVALIVFIAGLVYVHSNRPIAVGRVFEIDMALIVVLYLYRAIQDPREANPVLLSDRVS